MKKFRFRLQTLLDQRLAHEEQLLAELGELQREEAREVEKLRVMQFRLADVCQQIQKEIADSNLGEVSRLDDFANALRDDITIQELTIQAIHERVEAKRLELIEAMKERKVLEALRDKQQEEYIKAQMKAEQNEMDEMASVRYARGM